MTPYKRNLVKLFEEAHSYHYDNYSGRFILYDDVGSTLYEGWLRVQEAIDLGIRYKSFEEVYMEEI